VLRTNGSNVRMVPRAAQSSALVPFSDVLIVEADSAQTKASKISHLAVSLGIFMLADYALKKAATAAGISFPSALLGMFGIFLALITMDALAPKGAEAIVRFFKPATTFMARWLPLFFVPSLVVLPLAVRGIPPSHLLSILLIVVVGMVASCAFTAQAAVAIRASLKTELGPYEVGPTIPPFHRLHVTIWTAILLAGLVLASVSPAAIMNSHAATASIFFLAATILGFILGSKASPPVRKIFHPILCCAIGGQLGVLVIGLVSGQGFLEALHLYQTASGVSAGGILMSFLGAVVLSFAFQMYSRRALMMRHAPEIFGSAFLSALFSMFSTVCVGRLMGLPGDLTRALIPRSVTVALALPISRMLESGNLSLTAAVVVVTGLIGANFVQALLNRLGHKDPITRGCATAGSCHGLGTAALAAKEPDALPFSAITQALIGIVCSVLVAWGPVRSLLFTIAG